MLDDSELGRRVSAGDAHAFEAWYGESARRLLSFLRHLLVNPQAAEDVMQDTYTNIWLRPHGFDPERGTLRAWLYGIARRQAAEYWRKHKPTNQLESDGASPDRVEASTVMADLLAKLPADQRTLLWLREVEGQTYAELAVILDIPIGTVRSRLFAAREALRAAWHSAPQGGSHGLQ